MDNQKDILKYQKDNYISTDVNSFNINVFSDFIIKKTEKLVTALYMVTDCMDTEDAIKGKLRTLGVGLLSNAHSFLLTGAVEKQYKIDHSNSQISEIISLVEIANIMGFVSEMNSSILKKEFGILHIEYTRFLENNINKNISKKISFNTQTILDKQSFSVPLPVYKETSLLSSQFWQGNISKGHIKDNKDSVLYKNNVKDSTHKSDKSMSLSKEERIKKMLDLIKDKEVISIKDISYEFTDCSEKTIQRDLNNLVSKGQLKKTGSKRWSRYLISE